MSVAAVPAGDGPAGTAPGPAWAPAVPHAGWLVCGSHPHGPGRVDERARRLSHEELAVARLLAGDGHQVRAVAESGRGGRRPDLEVCGSPVEVKSFVARADRSRPPGGRSVYNKLVDGAGQAPAVVLFGGGSGLTPGAVRSGLAQLAASGRAPDLSCVRVVGDGFDLAWVRPAEPGLRPGRGHQPGPDVPPVPGRRAGPRAPGLGCGL